MHELISGFFCASFTYSSEVLLHLLSGKIPLFLPASVCWKPTKHLPPRGAGGVARKRTEQLYRPPKEPQNGRGVIGRLLGLLSKRMIHRGETWPRCRRRSGHWVARAHKVLATSDDGSVTTPCFRLQGLGLRATILIPVSSVLACRRVNQDFFVRRDYIWMLWSASCDSSVRVQDQLFS